MSFRLSEEDESLIDGSLKLNFVLESQTIDNNYGVPSCFKQFTRILSSFAHSPNPHL